jgi:hypothetical protein
MLTSKADSSADIIYQRVNNNVTLIKGSSSDVVFSTDLQYSKAVISQADS